MGKFGYGKHCTSIEQYGNNRIKKTTTSNKKISKQTNQQKTNTQKTQNFVGSGLKEVKVGI